MLFFVNKLELIISGDYIVSIMHDQKDIEGSPFKVRVFDPSKIRVGGLKGGMGGKTTGIFR